MHLYPQNTTHGTGYIIAAILTIIPSCLAKGYYNPPSLLLPPTPSLPQPYKSGYVNLTKVDIWYAQFGPPLSSTLPHNQSPILFLHGGLANSDWFGHQIASLLTTHPNPTILAIDSRLQGRSTGVTTEPISYDLMREDVVGVLDHFHIPKATVVGWSDGGIIGLNLAINAPSRLNRLFSFAASYSYINTNASVANASTFSQYLTRIEKEFKKLSPTPNAFKEQSDKINNMFATLPNYTHSDIAKIPTLYQDCENNPLVWIVDAADEEVINFDVPRTLHGWIPGSGLVILPSVSHFA